MRALPNTRSVSSGKYLKKNTEMRYFGGTTWTRRGRRIAATIASATISGPGRPVHAGFIVVRTKPGSISVTPMPSLRTSRRTLSFSPRSPNFDAE